MSSEPVPRLTLPRERRMTRNRDFQRARQLGQRLAVGCLVLNWAENMAGTKRLGVITSKKIGNAVARSRARRLLREAFRLHQHRLSRTADVVLVARNSIVEKDFAGVQRDLLAALGRSGLLKLE